MINNYITWTKSKESWLVAFRRRIEELRDEAVRVHRVVVNELGQSPESRLGRDEVVRVVALLDSVMIDSAFVTQRDRTLSRRRFRFPDEKRSVDSGTEEILGRVPRNGSVVPRVLLEGVDWSDVVGGDPADGAGTVVGLAPFARLVVA